MPEFISRLSVGLERYWGDISYLSVQHLQIVAISAVLALLVALPLGVWMSRTASQRHAMACMQFLNVGQAIPKLALLALAMSFVGVGSGAAIFALWVATLLPVAVNTCEGLRAVPRHLIEAAEAMGMTPAQVLWKVEIPNAMNVIFAGIRTALAINVGTAPLAFLVGGGGLGELIFTGIDLNDFDMMLAGAVSTALLAIAVDLACGLVQNLSVSRGLRLAGRV
ncbi:ABC transporter permease [Pseudomonas poae]|uniref:ABC transporter permease subunit n=1 Tax=Pseudomonas poae TaxID=200451 RepID=A0AAP2WKX5_9PSED|nr:ABC transporter permease [Pseudomonas poae]MCF5656911.1 ABC transporter permease subunit [Pseudomonas poae]NMZ50881.1 ABC transporter permease [Pseudomonas poae]